VNVWTVVFCVAKLVVKQISLSDETEIAMFTADAT
jgi:hypothetical protein